MTEHTPTQQYQHRAVRVLLDCANTHKVREEIINKDTKMHQLAFGPWNHKTRKEKKCSNNNNRFKNILARSIKSKQRRSSWNSRQVVSTPKRHRAIQQQCIRRSQPHNIVNLNQSLEQQHSKRKKQFILRQSNRRYRTLQKN